MHTSTTQDRSLTKASRSFKVDDDANIRAGQTILVGNEQMFVKQVGTSVLNVERGMNGTSAVAHDDGSLLKALSYPAEVVEATLLVAVDRWRRRDGIARSNDVATGTRDELYDPSGDICAIVGTVSKVEDMRAGWIVGGRAGFKPAPRARNAVPFAKRKGTRSAAIRRGCPPHTRPSPVIPAEAGIQSGGAGRLNPLRLATLTPPSIPSPHRGRGLG